MHIGGSKTRHVFLFINLDKIGDYVPVGVETLPFAGEKLVRLPPGNEAGGDQGVRVGGEFVSITAQDR